MAYNLGHHIQKTFYVSEAETGRTFTTGSGHDWDNDAVEFSPIADQSSITVANGKLAIDNAVSDINQWHPMVDDVKSKGSAASVAFYANGMGANNVAASGSLAERDACQIFVTNGVGLTLSSSHVGLTGGTSLNPTVSTDDQSAPLLARAGRFFDADTGIGEDRLIIGITGNTLTVWPPLSFTPAIGDRMEAGITTGMDQAAMTVYTDDHYSLVNYCEVGYTEDDYRAALGNKFNMGEVSIEAGAMPVFSFESVPVNTALSDTFSKPAATASYNANSGLVVGNHSLSLLFGNVEEALADVDMYVGSFGFGIEHNQQPCASGDHGVSAVLAGAANPTFNATMLLTGSQPTEFGAGQDKHAVMQLGNTSGEGFSVFFRNLEETQNAQRDAGEGAVRSARSFKPRYHTGSIEPALGSDEYSMLQSPVILFRAG